MEERLVSTGLEGQLYKITCHYHNVGAINNMETAQS